VYSGGMGKDRGVGFDPESEGAKRGDSLTWVKTKGHGQFA